MNRQFFVGAALVMVACAAPTSEEIMATNQSIIGGQNAVSGQFPAVGLLDFTVALCTGTVIDVSNIPGANLDPASPTSDVGHWVVTAGHCSVSEPNGTPLTAAEVANTHFRLGTGFGHFGTNVNCCDEDNIQVDQVIPRPGFVLANFFVGKDIGLVHLVTAVPPTVEGQPLVPIKMNRDALQVTGGHLRFTDHDTGAITFDAPDAHFTAVGYGNNDGQAGTGAGTKRFADINMETTDAEHIIFGNVQGIPNTCQGDSGGPSFVTVNGEVRIIAVTSGGAGGCEGDSFSQRTDVQAVPFTDTVIGNAPLVCAADGACNTLCPGTSDPDCCPPNNGVCEAQCTLPATDPTDHDCQCKADGFCQASSQCPASIQRDPDCPEPQEICGDGIDNDSNGVVDNGCGGCSVSAPGDDASFLLIGALFLLSLAVVSRRRAS